MRGERRESRGVRERKKREGEGGRKVGGREKGRENKRVRGCFFFSRKRRHKKC